MILKTIIRATIHVVAITVLVLIVSPLILGFSLQAAWLLPFQLAALVPGGFFTQTLVLVLFVSIMMLLVQKYYLYPVLTFVVGANTLMFLLGVFEYIYPGMIKGRVEYVPGIGLLLGLTLVVGLIGWVGQYLAIKIKQRMSETHYRQLTAVTVASLLGLVPVIIYAAWLGEQIRSV